LALPTDESVKLALRTQQLIAHESGIANYPDPFGGSYVIEELTDNLLQEAQQLIKQIDKMGGSVAAIENGWIQNEIVKSAYEYQKSVDSKEKIVIGVNKFIEDKSVKPELLKIDAKATKNQIKLLKQFKINRASNLVKTNLKLLRKKTQSEQNIFPQIINCVISNCTLGEIADILRAEFGEFHQN